MASKSHDLFLTIRSEGAILPPDLLQRIVAGDAELDGLKADDYHLPKGEKINEATSRAWNRLLGVWASFRAAAEKTCRRLTPVPQSRANDGFSPSSRNSAMVGFSPRRRLR